MTRAFSHLFSFTRKCQKCIYFGGGVERYSPRKVSLNGREEGLFMGGGAKSIDGKRNSSSQSITTAFVFAKKYISSVNKRFVFIVKT